MNICDLISTRLLLNVHVLSGVALLLLFDDIICSIVVISFA